MPGRRSVSGDEPRRPRRARSAAVTPTATRSGSASSPTVRGRSVASRTHSSRAPSSRSSSAAHASWERRRATASPRSRSAAGRSSSFAGVRRPASTRCTSRRSRRLLETEQRRRDRRRRVGGDARPRAPVSRCAVREHGLGRPGGHLAPPGGEPLPLHTRLTRSRRPGSGRTPTGELGWRRAAVVAGDQPSGWTGAAAFTAEFCALGGQVVTTSYRSMFTGRPDVVARSLAAKPDGVATFLNFLDDPATVLSSLASELGDPRRLLVWAPILEDPALMQALGARLDGVVGTTWLPSAAAVARPARLSPSVPRRVPRPARVPRRPVLVLGYHNAVEATLRALERVDSADVRSGLIEELATTRVALPGGTCRLDATGRRFATATSRASSSTAGRSSSSRSASCAVWSRHSAGSSPRAPPPGPGRSPA